MSHVITHCLTVVLPKPDEARLEDILEHVQAGENIQVLSEHKAVDVILDDLEAPDDLSASLNQFFVHRNLHADFCLQSLTCARRKRLLICDMDSTLIGQECIDELADFVGLKDKVSKITERAMGGEIDFDEALRERVGLLEGLPLPILQECFDTRITLNPGARTLAQTMKAHGAKTVIVSGGFTFFAEQVAAKTGFEAAQANVLLDDGSHLTGAVAEPILGREAKRRALNNYSAEFGGPENAVAVGDGANDLTMIEASGMGIAYCARPTVSGQADCAINHTDLTTALYFQGYSDRDFVS
ncbi:MAG: phosphoserine phosphatase SerB [Hyphomonadaceae bacterium]|nr:phosphoserine phosphatase SerB [Hyphomonadaceae bacterium]MBC6411686.1 phosphoserine phosphatase SerB [Hyphomonadaceae bacterium]